ncbi:hypothetical protein Tco_0507452 [Tanacetum coccineum]
MYPPPHKHQSLQLKQRLQQQPFYFHLLHNNKVQQIQRFFTLELRDLPHKIDEAVREAVKEAVHVALQAQLRDRFRELPEVDMKEILHQ